MDIKKLKNTYFGIRHGESHANVQGLIAGGEMARNDYGLTDKGRQQVIDSAQAMKNKGILNDQTVILTSPLKRARETADIAAGVLGVSQDKIVQDERIRERHFGIFEGQSHDAYKKVIWPADLIQQESEHGVEKTEDVKKRLLELIEELEKKYSNRHILLASHGDTLQILETYFKDISPSQHRSLPPIQNAEIRQYN